MFRSRSRGFYLYMFLRSCTEREIERERELDNLAIRYIYSFIEYCFEREVLRYKKRHPAISLSLFRYDCNLLDWILDGCIRTREPYSIPPSLSLSFEGLTNEDRIESLVCKFSRRVKLVKFAWRPTHGETILTICPPFVLFFHSCTVLRSII